MAASNDVAPVIIKRKKVSGAHAHHGGAWKVAYADFVTAMMAFFMLMWLLNATTEKQRKGIADYFSPSIPINRISGGGDGSFGGDSVFSQKVLPHDGVGGLDRRASESHRSRGASGVEPRDVDTARDDPLRELEDRLMGRGGESLVSPELQKFIRTRVTDEGLIIEISARPEAPIFARDTAEPTWVMQAILASIARVANLVVNPIAVAGHVRSNPIVLRRNPVWELSAARASAVRQELERHGIASARMQRVTGHADRKPAVPDPMAPQNDRIEVILLRD